MIEFSGEAVTDNGTKKLGFSAENEEVMSSPSLNCDITTLTRERPRSKHQFETFTYKASFQANPESQRLRLDLYPKKWTLG